MSRTTSWAGAAIAFLLTSAATAQPLPNTRLSLTSQPVMTADVVGAQTLHYTDGMGTDLTLSVASFPIGVYDIFNSGRVLATSGAPANYVGSVNVSVAGQLTAHLTMDYDRKWEVYNGVPSAQRDVVLQVITQERDFAYCPTNQYPNVLPFNGNPLNRGTAFTGRPENVEVTYQVRGFLNTLSGSYGLLNGVGWSPQGVVPTKISGVWGGGSQDAATFAGGVTLYARYDNPVAVGPNVATMMIAAAANSPCSGSQVNSANASNPNYTADDQGSMWIKWKG